MTFRAMLCNGIRGPWQMGSWFPTASCIKKYGASDLHPHSSTLTSESSSTCKAERPRSEDPPCSLKKSFAPWLQAAQSRSCFCTLGTKAWSPRAMVLRWCLEGLCDCTWTWSLLEVLHPSSADVPRILPGPQEYVK